MAAIILPSRWTRQPQTPVGIDWGNPITIGLADAGYGRYSAVTGAWGKPENATATYEGRRDGMSVSQTAATTRGTTFRRSGKYVNGTAQSLFVRANIRALIASSSNTLLAINYSASWVSPFTPMDLRNSASGGLVGQYLTCDAAGFTSANSGANFYSTTAGMQDYGLIRAGSNVDFMSAGIVHSSGTLGANLTTDFAGATGVLELNSSLGNEPADALISVWAIWCRALSKAEYASLSANAWQIFSPLKRKLYFAPVSAGVFSLNAEPASYVLTGAAATIVAGRVIDAQPGVYTFTGTDATLSLGRFLDAQPATYALTGIAANIVATRMLDAQPGAHTITGTAATVVAGRVLNAAPGSYAITGFAADLVYTVTGAFVINAEPGSFALTGTAASLVADRKLDAQPASYTMTGAAATVAAGRMISANAGAFSLTGFVANLVYVPSVGYVLDAQPATYALVGADAGVVTTRMVNAQSGIFALTGTAATLLQSGAGFGRPVTMKFTVRKRKARMELN